jgi:hypothetical protein
MIVVPLVVPDQPLAVSELEGRVQDWGQQLMRQGLAAAWAAQAPLRPVANCPGCGAGESRPAGCKARQVETVFGAVALLRQRRHCAGWGRHYQPDDAMLVPELGAGQLSPHLRELTALCGASWPYRQAAELLGRPRGRPLSAETVRAVVGTIGSVVAASQAQEAAGAVAPLATAPTPGRLVPAWVHSHDNPHGLEVKVGVVPAGSAVVGRTRRRLRQRDYQYRLFDASRRVKDRDGRRSPLMRPSTASG